jgi:hypothetical protein
MKSKPIKLTDPQDIAYAKEFRTAQERFMKEINALQAKHRREVDEHVAAYKKEARRLFRLCTQNVLDDPDESFSNQRHQLNLDYVLEYGDAYLAELPSGDGDHHDEDDEGDEDREPPTRPVIIQ